MKNINKVIADLLLGDLYLKNSQGADISKKEFEIMIENYKINHENIINENSLISKEQKNILKELYNKTADNIKDYSLECLRIKGRLIE